MTTEMQLQHRVEDYAEGIQNYPKNFTTTLKGLKAWRKLQSFSSVNKLPTKKVSVDFDEFTSMVSNMLAYNKIGREKTLEFITMLDQQLCADNIEI